MILGDEYEDAIESLSLMKEDKPDSSKDETRKSMGFGTGKKSRRHKLTADDSFMKELREME